MVADLTERRINKRKGPDIWVKIINWLGVSAWVLMAVVVWIVDMARPQLATMFDRLFNIPLRTSWNVQLVWIALALLIFIFFLCFTGLTINLRRHRRKDDRYNRSLIIMGISAAIGIFICLVSGALF